MDPDASPLAPSRAPSPLIRAPLLTALGIAAALLVGLLAPAVVGYGPGPIYRIKVTGPSRELACEQSVTIQAKVVSTDTGKPVRRQVVRWSLSKGSGRDRLSARQTTTGRDGTTSITLFIGLAVGDRQVKATASGSSGRVTVQVRCVLPTPTPRPTARPTPRPTQKPRTTPRPRRTERPRATVSPQAGVERGTLAIVYRETDLAGRAPLLLAIERGAFAEAGLEGVTLVEAPDGLPGVLDGTLDVAIVPLAAAARAIAQGQPLVILAAYQNFWPNLVAVRPDIADVTALYGQPVILDADPLRSDAQRRALADAGWDLDEVAAQLVSPDGDADAWLELLDSGQVALTPVLNRNRLPLDRGGVPLLVDQQEFGEDVLVARRNLLDDAPRTVQAFLEAYLAGLRLITEPANDPDLFLAAERAGIDVSPRVQGGWPNDLEDFRPWDGGFGLIDDEDGLAELHAYLLQALGWLPPPADLVAWQQLNAAQADLGLGSDPVIPVLADAGGVTARVGLPDGLLATRAPFLLADALGAQERAGLAIELVPGAAAIDGLLDGSLDVAVMDQAEAAAAIEAGEPIVIVAGYQGSGSGGEGATVLVAGADASNSAVALAPLLQAYLRGLAGLNRDDALTLAVVELTDAVADDELAAFPAAVARYAPFDGSLGDGAPAAGTDLTALRAAQASLGLPVDIAP